jgi:uncharacterized protein involved in outer membrane biogenesis
VIIGLALLALIAIALMHTDRFQSAFVRYTAARLSRHVDVRGTLDLDLFSSSPSLTATDVTLSNPSWMPPGEVARIGRLSVVFDFPWPGRKKTIRRLELISAQLHLVRDGEGRANWQWQPPGAPKQGVGFMVRSLNMPNAHVVLDDARRHLQFEGSVTAADVRGPAPPVPFRIEGKGQLNGRAATFSIDGDPLATANHDRPYAFSFEERSGNAQLRGRGHLLRPFNPGVLDADFAANGASMSELYFLAGMHFPNTAPFTLTGNVERRERQSIFKNLETHFGRSDVRGTVVLAMVDNRARYDADLSSQLLRLSDFGRHDPDGSLPPSSGSSSLLLPDTKVPLNGLRNRDATVRYRADSIESRSLSFDAFSTQATVDDGVLSATGIKGRFRNGHISGSAKIDVRGDIPQTTLDLRMSDLPLDQFARKENERPPFEGRLEARLAITGSGNSVHQVAASANGALSLAMLNGAMRASMAEMTATTLRGLGLTLTKSDEETQVRCANATFRAHDGVLSAERIAVDTESVVISGTGEIHLDTEALDLTLHGEPRKRRLVRLGAPVSLAGSLKHPEVHIGSRHAVAQNTLLASAADDCDVPMVSRISAQ